MSRESFQFREDAVLESHDDCRPRYAIRVTSAAGRMLLLLFVFAGALAITAQPAHAQSVAACDDPCNDSACDESADEICAGADDEIWVISTR